MIGESLAHYQITAKLGQGGMGAVYRATDTKLDREVAIKVLPESFAQDRERLARFEREAKLLASLNHPNIAGIFGLEQTGNSHALVLELVEGEDLSERLKREPLPVDEALDVCKQIAEALEAAHEKGIIHRDLKPGNVKLTADGKVKVLDFGLAKTATADTSSIDPNSPTITHDYTLPGTLLGTAGYMSPEQARGKPVDKRSDIWSFGVVLYEYLTGKRLFTGETATDSIGALLHKEIDWSQLPAGTPPTIQLLLRKCLVRDRKRRLQDIGDARIDLEQAVADPSSSFIRLSEGALQEAKAGHGMSGPLVMGFVVGVAVIAVALGWFLKPTPPPPAPLPAKHSQIVPRGSASFFAGAAGKSFALSRDGKTLVYNLGAEKGGFRLRNLVTGEDKPIRGTEHPNRGHPFLSWNGSHLGYVLGDKLVTIPVSGGTPRSLEVSGITDLTFAGADWSKKGDIVFTSLGDPLRLIPEKSGQARAITELAGEIDHVFPQFLPDGDHVLFVAIYEEGGENFGRAAVVDVRNGKRTDLDVGDCRFARYCPSGHLLYSVGNEVFARAFDLKRLAVSGPAQMVLHGLRTTRFGEYVHFDVAEDGTLVYLPGEAPGDVPRTLMWVDTQGHTEPFTQLRGNWEAFDLSPNEERVALEIDGDIWILDRRGQAFDQRRPLVTNDAVDKSPLWSSDSKWVYFYSNRDGKQAVWKKKADFADAPAELVCESPSGALFPSAVSSNTLVMSGLSSGGFDIWRLDLNDENAQPRPWMNETYPEGWSAISPDGKWLAYYTDDPKVGSECYLRSMDGSTGSQLVSNEGGERPRWSPTGDRIFYLWKSTIYSVSLSKRGSRLIPKKPKEVVTLQQSIYGLAKNWTVSQDGQRFLMLVEAAAKDSKDQTSAEPAHLEMISNWFTELNKKVPTGAN